MSDQEYNKPPMNKEEFNTILEKYEYKINCYKQKKRKFLKKEIFVYVYDKLLENKDAKRYIVLPYKEMDCWEQADVKLDVN